ARLHPRAERARLCTSHRSSRAAVLFEEGLQLHREEQVLFQCGFAVVPSGIPADLVTMPAGIECEPRSTAAARRQTSVAAVSFSIWNLRSFSTSVVRRSLSRRAAWATVPPARFSAC